MEAANNEQAFLVAAQEFEAIRSFKDAAVLVKECREKAEALGCRNLELGVWTFNESAIAFYESCGMKARTLRMELRLC